MKFFTLIKVKHLVHPLDGINELDENHHFEEINSISVNLFVRPHETVWSHFEKVEKTDIHIMVYRGYKLWVVMLQDEQLCFLYIDTFWILIKWVLFFIIMH